MHNEPIIAAGTTTPGGFTLTPLQREAVDLALSCVDGRRGQPAGGYPGDARTFLPPASGACLVGYAGCHAPDERVLLYSGETRRAADVVVGDVLMGPDSLPRYVCRLERGRGPMVRVCPVKGEPLIVNLDHVLTVRLVAPYPRKTMDVRVRDFLEWAPTKRAATKLLRADVVAFPDAHGPAARPVDPYLLGVLLGDGALRSGVAICKDRPEIEQLAQEQAVVWGLSVRVWRKSDGHRVFYLTSGRSGKNPLVDALRKIGVHGKDAFGKFVPAAYLTGPVPVRAAVLAGLLDTDGHCERSGFDYISASRQLAEDVAFLARSLGQAAYVKECRKSDQNGTWGTYWRVGLSGDFTSLPLRIKPSAPRRQCKSVRHTGFTIEPWGEGDYYGWTLAGADGRFLMADFTVTHNTGKSVVLSEIARQVGDGSTNMVTVLAPTGKAALRLRAEGVTGAMTIHRWCYRPAEDAKTGKLRFTFNPASKPYRGVVLIDEGSMVGSDVADDIQRALVITGARAVVVGDGFQLPPVGGKRGDSLLARWEAEHPTVRLTEILRQAGGSPVIQASLLVREGKPHAAMARLPSVAPERLTYALPRMVERGGAIIVHRNETRQRVNALVRHAFGKDPSTPVAGEPLLVLQNTYTVDAYNGELVDFLEWVEPPAATSDVIDRFAQKAIEVTFGCARIRVRGGDPVVVVLALEGLFAAPEMEGFHGGSLSQAAEAWARKHVDQAHWTPVEVEDEATGTPHTRLEPPPFMPAHFGYAYTCHKMQGSQAPNVLVLVEPTVKLKHTDGQRWLYTAITRARVNAAVCMTPRGWG